MNNFTASQTTKIHKSIVFIQIEETKQNMEKLSRTKRKISMSATSRCQYIQDLNLKFSFKLCGKPAKPMNSFYFILDVVKQ